MEEYDVDMDEEEEGEVFIQKATLGHWWEDHCGDDGHCDTSQHGGGGGEGEKGCMVNSRSWTEQLQGIFAPQTVDCYSGERNRVSSISVSQFLPFLYELQKQ